MILTLEPTDRFETVEGTPCRVWTGTADGGVPVHAWIRCVSPQTHDADANEAFARQLRQLPPARREPGSCDLRFVV